MFYRNLMLYSIKLMLLTVQLLQARLDGFYVFLLILSIDMLQVLQNILGKVGLEQWE